MSNIFIVVSIIFFVGVIICFASDELCGLIILVVLYGIFLCVVPIETKTQKVVPELGTDNTVEFAKNWKDYNYYQTQGNGGKEVILLDCDDITIVKDLEKEESVYLTIKSEKHVFGGWEFLKIKVHAPKKTD